MANVIVQDFDQREVFADEERCEAAIIEADRADHGAFAFGAVRERIHNPAAGRNWFYVVVRRLGSHERVGYLGPASD